MSTPVILGALAAVVCLLPASAQACAACACGNPTLTTMGMEQPFEGRLRFSSSVRAWGSDTAQEGGGTERLRELRLDLTAAYAPVPWLFLSVSVPFQARELVDISLARERAVGIGDVELSSRFFLLRDERMQPRYLVSLVTGLELPTAPVPRASDGSPLSLHAHLGSGSFDPLLGVAYMGFFSAKWSLYASTTGQLPMRGYDGFRAGLSVRSTLAAQYQPDVSLAFRLGMETRVESAADHGGVADPIGSGFVGFLAPDILWSPATDLVVQVGARLPAMASLRGQVRFTPILMAAVSYDL